METSINATEKENWKETIPHRVDVLLEGMDIFKDHLVLSERINGITNLRVRNWSGDDHYIDFGEDAFMAYTSVNRDFDTDVLRICLLYTSPSPRDATLSRMPSSA